MSINAEVLAIAGTWVGTPYRHQGAVKGVGCDCLGLVRGIWRELYGREPEAVPAYAPDWAERAGEERLIAAAERHFGAVSSLEQSRPGDLVLFRFRPHLSAKHAGILARLPAEHDQADKGGRGYEGRSIAYERNPPLACRPSPPQGGREPRANRAIATRDGATGLSPPPRGEGGEGALSSICDSPGYERGTQGDCPGPGGLVAFSEPGCDHADAAASKVCLVPNAFIHAYEQSAVTLSALVPGWRRKIAGIYRFPERI